MTFIRIGDRLLKIESIVRVEWRGRVEKPNLEPMKRSKEWEEAYDIARAVTFSDIANNRVPKGFNVIQATAIVYFSEVSGNLEGDTGEGWKGKLESDYWTFTGDASLALWRYFHGRDDVIVLLD